MSDNMTSNRPYLVRAIYDWISDNGLTAHVLVDAEFPGVEVPREYVQDGRIVLNVSASAVQGFIADNDELTFSARFAGRPMTLRVPMDAVLAVYARENGQGMAFDPVTPPQGPEPSPPEADKDSSPAADGRPHLKVIK